MSIPAEHPNAALLRRLFDAFGRINATHPHTWEFADSPVVNGRLLGPDGLRGVGAGSGALMMATMADGDMMSTAPMDMARNDPARHDHDEEERQEAPVANG